MVGIGVCVLVCRVRDRGWCVTGGSVKTGGTKDNGGVIGGGV